MSRTEIRVLGFEGAIRHATTIDIPEDLHEPFGVVAFAGIEPEHLLIKVAV